MITLEELLDLFTDLDFVCEVYLNEDNFASAGGQIYHEEAPTFTCGASRKAANNEQEKESTSQ